MAERSRRSMLPAWGVSSLLHVALIAVLALIVLHVPAQRETITQVLLQTGQEDASANAAAAQDADARVAASHKQARSEGGSGSKTTFAPPTVTPPIQAAGSTLKLLDLDTQRQVQYVDPTANVLNELANDPAAQTAAGQGTNPMLTGTSSGFQQAIGGMRGRGLDVVFVFDATSSMKPYVDQAKQRIRDVIAIISGLLSSDGRPPQNLRFGVVAFKDYGDEYGVEVVRVLTLTRELEEVETFINRIQVSGGGDEPEPTHLALLAATDARMGWSKGRKNVIILVSDAPIHANGRKAAVDLARSFNQRFAGVVNVIDVNSRDVDVQPDLANVAMAGAGSAFTIADAQGFWQHLIVSIFGQRFESDVQTIVERYTQTSQP